MIILSTTSDKIQVVLNSAVTTNELKCFVSYTDTTTTSITPSRNVLTTNGVTAVDLVTSPASSTQRLINYMSVYNTDTVDATVTIQLYNPSTTYTLFNITLLTGERLEYQQGEGFCVFASNGSLKVSPNAIGTPYSNTQQYTLLTGDVSITGTSFVDITGLSFPVLANKRYWFKFYVLTTAAATPVGHAWSINGPSFVNLMYYSYYPSSATLTQYNNGASAYNTGTVTASTPTRGLAVVEGIIEPSANGTLIASARSENTLSVTAKNGSVVFYQQLT